MPATEYDGGSFRDRDGRVFRQEGRVFRALSERALEDWEALAAAPWFADLVARGAVVATRRVEPSAEGIAPPLGRWAAILEHRAIPFVSYPYEWSFGMLRDAALLELELLLAALDGGMILKDGTPYNVQWVGSRPQFIDLASFALRRRAEPWAGYRQFCRLFLYPLMLQAYKGVDFQPWLRGGLEGIDPVDFCRLLSARDLLRRGVFAHAWLHARAQTRFDATEHEVRSELARAGFRLELVRTNARRLSKLVAGLSWRPQSSEWAGYAEDNSYTAEDRRAKEGFVREAVTARPRRMVWDLGANTGAYARIAAEAADYVVAMDADHLAVERLYRGLREERCDRILPLVLDLADPSPALGFRGAERRRLSDRGRPELVLCLALVHHLVIGANLPLAELVGWLADLGGDLVVEWVAKEDPMVRRLLRNREDVFSDYQQSVLESCLQERFRIERRLPLGRGTRTLYQARRRR